MSMSSIFYKSVRGGRAQSAPRERPAGSPEAADPTTRRPPFLLDLVDRWGRR